MTPKRKYLYEKVLNKSRTDGTRLPGLLYNRDNTHIVMKKAKIYTLKNEFMKAETLQKRIESRLTLKNGKTIAKVYDGVTDFIIYNRTSHPYYYSGSGRFVRCAGVDRISAALKLIGVDFEIGNDAPRGGHSGHFIKLSKKGLAQTKDFREKALKVEAERALKVEAEKAEQKKVFDEKVADIKLRVSNDIRLQAFIARKKAEGEKIRTTAWKLTSCSRTPNLSDFSISQIMGAIL